MGTLRNSLQGHQEPPFIVALGAECTRPDPALSVVTAAAVGLLLAQPKLLSFPDSSEWPSP